MFELQDLLILAGLLSCVCWFVDWRYIVSLYVSLLVLLVTIAIYRVATFRLRFQTHDVVQTCVATVRDQLLGNKARIAAALVAACAIAAVTNRLSRTNLVAQGSMPSRPKVEFKVGPVPDTWKRVEVTDVKNMDSITGTGKQLAELLTKKMCTVRVYTGNTVEYAVATPVCTNFWVVPFHLIEKDYEYVRIEHTSDDVINFSHSMLRAGSYRRIGITDFALLYMPGKGDQKDIVKFFPEEQFSNGDCRFHEKPARLVLMEQDKVVNEYGKTILVPKRSTHCVRVTSSHIAPKGTESYWGGSYVSPVATFAGMCGSMLITEGNGPYIIGLHSAGISGTNKACYCTITREAILHCIQQMTSDETPMMQGSESGNYDVLDNDTMPFHNSVPKDSHFSFMEKAEVDIIGCHTGRKRRYTSMVQQTDYSEDIELEFGVACRHGKPALMNHWYPGRLWAEAAATTKSVDMRYLRLAYKEFRGKIFGFLQDAHKESVCVLEDIVNTSGLDGMKGLYKMNYLASAGIPYCKPKKNYVKQSSDFFDGITVPYVLTDDMAQDVKELEDIYKSGKRGYAPHRANRKDEAIRIGKAKVRIFSGTSMPYLFLMRKYFLAISVFMQQHPNIFESAVGVNPYSREWTQLYDYIVSKPEKGDNPRLKRVVAGDYEKYDQYVHSCLTYAAFKLLIEIAVWAGFDEEDVMVMRGLATDTCNPVYELDGIWVKFGSSSPSGHGLTVVLNGYVNSFYARIAYYHRLCAELKLDPDNLLTEQWCTVGKKWKFSKHVAFMSYGDDNVMSVSPEASFFNHCSYQAVLQHYGLNYTMADKETDSVPYITIEQASFLKRKWVWSDEYSKHMAPLEMDSIFKMLHTFTVSKVSPKQQQLADILRSANQEFFMHGEEVFVSSREKLDRIATKYELKHFLPGGVLPSLEEMKDWYIAME